MAFSLSFYSIASPRYPVDDKQRGIRSSSASPAVSWRMPKSPTHHQQTSPAEMLSIMMTWQKSCSARKYASQKKERGSCTIEPAVVVTVATGNGHKRPPDKGHPYVEEDAKNSNAMLYDDGDDEIISSREKFPTEKCDHREDGEVVDEDQVEFRCDDLTDKNELLASRYRHGKMIPRENNLGNYTSDDRKGRRIDTGWDCKMLVLIKSALINIFHHMVWQP